MKVLIWNIQNFTLGRIFAASSGTDPVQMDEFDRAFANWMYINTTVLDADPDLFVVIEPRCSRDKAGRLATGKGVEALVRVLLGLRIFSSLEWMLVPPLVVNEIMYDAGNTVPDRSETVGVFWREDRLQFTGPWIWPQLYQTTGPSLPAQYPGALPAANYPDVCKDIVPSGTQVAPAWQWMNPETHQPFTFPDARDRQPLLTSFVERKELKRTITLVAFHPSPARARFGLTALAAMLRSNCVPAHNELTLAAGDMNVNLLASDTPDYSSLDLFGCPYTLPPYTLIAPVGLAPTMLKPSVIGGLDPTRLATAANYTKPECIDYGLVCYGPMTPAPPLAPAARVVDRVAGAPAAPPFPAVTSHMATPLEVFRSVADVALRDDHFRRRWNYGHISPPNPGTSDHLPVLIVV